MKLIFAGTPEFAKTALSQLVKENLDILAVYTAPDKPKGRGQKLQMSPVKTLALEQHLPVYQPETLRDLATQQTLKDLNPDIMVVAAYGLLLPKAVLSIPRLGCINIHASLLPRWRGAAPIQHAIIAGDNTTGITIMQMNEGLDTGDILLQTHCEIRADETSETLFNRLAEVGAKAIVDALLAIEQKQLKAIPQNADLACYAAKLNKTDGLINWENSTTQLDRNIRAFNPWPVAYSYLNHELIRIWRAAPLPKPTNPMPPGTIIATTANAVHVATGDGALVLLELQFPGGKRLETRAILHAKPEKFMVGNRFGD